MITKNQVNPSCSNKFFLLVLLEKYEGQDIRADIATKRVRKALQKLKSEIFI